MEKSVFEMMTEKKLYTDKGTIFYWVSKCESNITLVLLHGMTADHTLFSKQIPHFLGRFNILCWDTPAHGKSRPYPEFTYANAVENLKAILEKEQLSNTVFVGQSMGGYITQTYMKYYPNEVKAFVGIDTSPFGKYPKSDLWWLRQIEWMSMCFTHKLLVKSMAKSCTCTKDAYQNMISMLAPYSKRELCRLMGIGYAGVLEENCDLDITCPTLILLGEHDKTGKVKQYCKDWHERTGFPLHIIPDAAHNSNYDNSEAVNREIDEFLESL